MDRGPEARLGRSAEEGEWVEIVQQLQRETFRTSRLLDFFSEKELVAQTGHQVADWPLVILKELIDNALDACEEVGIAPVISVTVDEHGIEVTDNGPGFTS
jgi:DNA topoisomerase VI subunit B